MKKYSDDFFSVELNLRSSFILNFNIFDELVVFHNFEIWNTVALELYLLI